MAENGYGGGAVAGHIGRIPNFSRQNNTSQPAYEPPACIQNAMMTKDKKPFTYTPGGLDLSQIKTPSMARRLNHRQEDEQMHYPQAQTNGGSAQVGGGPPKPPPPPPQAPPPPPLVIQAPQAKSPKPQLGERPEIIIPDNPIGMLRKTNSPYHWEQEKAEREKQGAKFVEKSVSPVPQNTLAPSSFTQKPPQTYSAPPQQNIRVPDSPVHRPEPQYAPPQSPQVKPQFNSPSPSNYQPQGQWKQPTSPTVQQQQWSQPPPTQNNYTRQLMSPPTVQNSPNQWNQQSQPMSPTNNNQQRMEQPQRYYQLSPQPAQNSNQRPAVQQHTQNNWNSQPAQTYNSQPPPVPQHQVAPQYQTQTRQQAPTYQQAPQKQAPAQQPPSFQNWRQPSQETEEPQIYTGISQNPWKQLDGKPSQQPQPRQIPVQIQTNPSRPQESPKPNHISWKQPVQETQNYNTNAQQQNYGTYPGNRAPPTNTQSYTNTLPHANKPNERSIPIQYVNGNSTNYREPVKQADSNNNYQQSRNGQPESYQTHMTIPVKPRQQPSPQQNREVVYVTQEPCYYHQPETVPPPFIKKKEKTPPPEWVHIADSRRSIPKEIPAQRMKSPEPEWVNRSQDFRRSVPRDLMSPPPLPNPQPVWSTKPSDNRRKEESNVRVLPIQVENNSRGYQHNQPQMRIVMDTRPTHNLQPTEVLLSKVSSPHMVRLDDIMPGGGQNVMNNQQSNAQSKTRIIPIQIESNGSGANRSYTPKLIQEAPRQSKAFRVLQTITGTHDNELLLLTTDGIPYTDF